MYETHIHTYEYMFTNTRLKFIHIFMYTSECIRVCYYGVATISRLSKIIGLCCKRTLQKRLYSAKETYNFQEPTNRRHRITYILTHNTDWETCMPTNKLARTLHICTWKRCPSWQHQSDTYEHEYITDSSAIPLFIFIYHICMHVHVQTYFHIHTYIYICTHT